MGVSVVTQFLPGYSGGQPRSIMGCGGSKDREGAAMELDKEGSDASKCAEKKEQIHPNMSQEELDQVLDGQFFEMYDHDSLTQINEWDNMDEFEFIDAPGAFTPAHSGHKPADDFDPNNEDSQRHHYILDRNAEWVGQGPKVGSLAAVDRQLVTTMSPDTWCAGWGENFKLRIGPNYKQFGKKDNSLEAIYSVVAADIIMSSHPNHDIASQMQLPKVHFKVNSKYVTPILVINIQLPLGSPWLFSRTNNGPCMQLVTTMVMKEKYARQWDDLSKAPPACRQLEEYMRVAPEEQDDGSKAKTYRWRWKFIGRCENGVPSALKAYNGKPALITQDGRLHRGGHYTEMDINVADWCKPARISLYTMFATVPERTLSLAHVIESRDDEHMPEQTLCCLQIDRLSSFTDKEWDKRDKFLEKHPNVLDGDRLFR